MNSNKAKYALKKAVYLTLGVTAVLIAVSIFFMLKDGTAVGGLFFESLLQDLKEDWLKKIGIGIGGFGVLFFWCYFIEDRDRG